MENKTLYECNIDTQSLMDEAWYLWENSDYDIPEKEMDSAIEKIAINAAAPCESYDGIVTNFEAWLWNTNMHDLISDAISTAIVEYIHWHINERTLKED